MKFDTITRTDAGAWRGTIGACELEVVRGQGQPGSRKFKWYGRVRTMGKWPVIVDTGPHESAEIATACLCSAIEDTVKQLQRCLE